MSLKGMSQVNKNLDRISEKIVNQHLEKALYIASTVGAGYATMMTPVDTSNLINSQYIKLIPTSTGWTAKIGYTANYAAAVHGKKGTLKGKPRANGNGTYWAPQGEPHFLTKGFEDNRQEISQAFYKGMNL